MLRVWKPKSPMNLGAWALSGYSLPTGLLAVKQLTGDISQMPALAKKAGALVPTRLAGAAGIPFALAMLSYPGVLLSTTSTPVWSRTRFLGALFAAGSMSTGAAALSLALTLSGKEDGKAVKQLDRIENLTSLAEAAALTAYIVTSKDSAAPLVKGRYSKLFWIGAVGTGLIVPAVIRATASKKVKKSRAKTVVGSILSLAGGLALKWAVTHAGRASAEDAQTARNATRPNDENPGLSSNGAGV
jgi:formate-dependent nitrite reductase membrane component NrfD